MPIRTSDNLKNSPRAINDLAQAMRPMSQSDRVNAMSNGGLSGLLTNYLSDSLSGIKRVPGLIENLLNQSPEKIARGVLGPAYTSTTQAPLVANFVGPQADIKGMVEDSSKVMPNLREGKYFDAAGNLALAAAAIPMMAVPGTVAGVRKGVNNLIGHNGGPPIYSDAGIGRTLQGRITPEVRRIMEKYGQLESGKALIGKRGQRLGVPTPYSKNLKVDEDYLAKLDQGLNSNPSSDLTPQKFITPEDLEGKTVMTIWGDRMSVADIDKVGGSAISPYRTGGGMNYIRDLTTGDWASGQGAINGMLTHINNLKKSGADPVGVFSPYAGTGSDYSLSTIDMFYRIKDVSPAMSNVVKKTIDAGISERIAKENFAKGTKSAHTPKFPGIGSKHAYDFFKKYPSVRKYFVETIDNSKFRELTGAPDVVKIRHALTDPNLKDNIRGSVNPLVGETFVDLSGTPHVRQTGTGAVRPNDTYSHDVIFGNDPNAVGAENYMGGYDVNIPLELQAPDWINPRRAAGIPVKRDVYEMRKSPAAAAQYYSPEVVDKQMLYRENVLRNGALTPYINRQR